MSRNLLPGRWETERLKVVDSTLDEVRELQQIKAEAHVLLERSFFEPTGRGQ